MKITVTYKRLANISDAGNITQCLPKEDAKEALRQLRDKECYPIINRGGLWYKMLTEEQVAELEKWYEDWRNVTDTLVVPKKPEWLK
jgi:hypothetical protein